MKKTIKILSIVAVIVSVSALVFAFFVGTVFWESACIKYNILDIVAYGPVPPLSIVLYLIGYTVVSLLLLISLKSQHNRIALEIAAIILLGVAIPVLGYFANIFQTVLIGRYVGNISLKALGATSQILDLPLKIGSLASPLCLITSGMRISEKINARKYYNVNY